MHVVHVTTSLDNGGAQAVLYNLVQCSTDHQHSVVCLTGPGKYSSLLEDAGVPVFHGGMARGKISLGGCRAVYRAIKSSKPDVVQSWMYHGDLLGGIFARLAGCRAVVWGIHNSAPEEKTTSRNTRIVVKLLARISHRVPRRIISCSQKALEVHAALGYPRERMIFVANGYDLDRFQPDSPPPSEQAFSVERQPGDVLFATVARWNAQKNQANLVAAACVLRDRFNAAVDSTNKPTFRCLFIGPQMTADNAELMAIIEQNQAADVIELRGETSDVPGVMNLIDSHVLPSAYGEAFPNVVAEGMACGVPCVVTDVGDAAYMVGETGWVVPPRSPELLADALAQVIDEVGTDAWLERKRQCRQRATEEFALATMVERYEAVWQSAVTASS